MMFKLMMVVLGAFISSSSFSGGDMSVMAGPCVHLHNPHQCVNYPTGECFWDYADQRCESYYNTEDRCSLINSQWQCIHSQYNCFWDFDDQRCEHRG